MAKLKAPLLSFGASGAIAKAIVYFPWKGLNVAREYVIPSNPRTTLQTTQRGYLTDAVAAVHAAQAFATFPLAEADVMAYALWAAVVKAATTWFNQAVKEWMDRHIAGKLALVCRGGDFSGISSSGFTLNLRATQFSENHCETGQFRWGTSKTALINIKAATPTLPAMNMMAEWSDLATKTKYYVQFEGLTTEDYLGAKGPIYHVTTT